MAGGLTGLAGLYGGYISAGQNTQKLFQQELQAEAQDIWGKAIRAAQLGTEGTPASVAGTTMGPGGAPAGPPGQPETYAGMPAAPATIGAPSLTPSVGAAAPSGAPAGGTPIATPDGAPAPGGPSSAGSPGVPGVPPTGVPYAIGPGIPMPQSPYGPTGAAGAPGGGSLAGAGGGGYPAPAGTGGMGTWDLNSIISMIVKANPNARPAAIAEAVNLAIPSMNAQALAQWNLLRPQFAQENINARLYGIESANQRTADILAQKDRALAETGDLKLQLQRERLAAAEARQRAGIASKEDLEMLRQAGLGARQDKAIQARHEDVKTRTEALTPPQKIAFNNFLKEHPGSSSEQQAAFLRSLRPTSAAATKGADRAAQAGELQTEIGSMIKDLDRAIADPSNSVTGVGGRIKRGLEWFQGLLGDKAVDTTATEFQAKVRLLQMQTPRLLTGASRMGKDEREHLDQIISGLSTFVNPQQARNNLLYLNSVLQRLKEQETGTPELRGGATPGARGVTTERITPSAEVPSSAEGGAGPPANILKQGIDTRVRNSDTGKEEVWTLDNNGQPIQVMNPNE